MQQPQTWRHAELRVLIYNLLVAAIEHARVSYFAAPNGMTARISEDEAFEPDALVAPLPKPAGIDLEIPKPVLVVEVLSPSSVKRDLSDKLAGYFQVPSTAHYLVIDPEEREVIWYRRAAGGALEPPVPIGEGVLTLDPPGIELDVADISRPTEVLARRGVAQTRRLDATPRSRHHGVGRRPRGLTSLLSCLTRIGSDARIQAGFETPIAAARRLTGYFALA
jgi:Uma2 family endonuclease